MVLIRIVIRTGALDATTLFVMPSNMPPRPSELDDSGGGEGARVGGWGVAPSNSEPNVKAAALQVLPKSNNEDAIAEVSISKCP